MTLAIVNENCAFAVKALSLQESVANRPELSVRWTTTLRPFKVAQHAALLQNALLQNEGAQVILISAECANEFPAQLRVLLERWSMLQPL